MVIQKGAPRREGREVDDLKINIPRGRRDFHGDFRCPVCGGADDDPRGHGIRCSGFMSADGWAHCSRVASKWPDPSGRTWAHPPATGRVALHEPGPWNDSKSEERRRTALADVMAGSVPAIAPEAEPMRLYLAGRGIKQIPRCLRFHPGLPYYENGIQTGTYPAMLALLTAVTGKPVTIHRTYLTSEGRKAPVSTARKLMPSAVQGAIRGCAVHLGEAENCLAIAEGIESGSSYQALKGLPTWAAISTSGMVAVEIPSFVEEVIIAADHDEAGQKAARRLARRLLGDGLRVRIDTPPIPGQDWNDVLTGGLA